MNKKMMEKVDAVVKLYDAGHYGTFDKPNRSGVVKNVFWKVAMGHRDHSEYRNCVTYPAAFAGSIVRNAREEK